MCFFAFPQNYLVCKINQLAWSLFVFGTLIPSAKAFLKSKYTQMRLTICKSSILLCRAQQHFTRQIGLQFQVVMPQMRFI